MSKGIRLVARAILPLVAVTALGMTGAAATAAAPAPHGAIAAGQVSPQDWTCTINKNQVSVWDHHPHRGGGIIGWTNAGQKMNVQWIDNNYNVGQLWGSPNQVWIWVPDCS